MRGVMRSVTVKGTDHEGCDEEHNCKTYRL